MQTSPLESAVNPWGAPTLDGFDTSSVGQGQRIGGSNRQYVRFYKKNVPETYATKVRTDPKTGTNKVLATDVRNVEVEYVHIVTPGDKNEIDQPAQLFHKKEHFIAYTAFRDGKTAPIGIDVEETSFIAPSVALELKYRGCHTVEQLADGSDLLCEMIPNGFELREFARGYCKQNITDKSNAESVLLRSELTKSQETIAAMAAQMSEMQSMLVDLKGRPMGNDHIKRGPGRPKAKPRGVETE